MRNESATLTAFTCPLFSALIWLLLLAAPFAYPAAPGAADAPRIALVLSGGGARGGAHIGVLKVLEDLRVPVHCIAGTSMGALVGGTYATGVPARRIEHTVVQNDWTDTFTRASLRGEMPMRLKQDGDSLQNPLELGIGTRGVATAGGLVATQGVEDMIRHLVAAGRGTEDFDDLPIPFRAVATDVVASEMVVLGDGDLVIAMRSSMAVPGAFAPVRLGDRVLVDGGLVRNLPVDVARQACDPDVVIAVRLQSPVPQPDDLLSSLAVTARTIDVVIQANELAQWQALNPRDIGIVVPIENFDSGDFGRIAEVIPQGEAAARAHAGALSRYALSPDDYLAWREGVRARRLSNEASLVEQVRISGLVRVDPDYVLNRLRTIPGTVVDEAAISADADRIFALGEFERVDYQVSGAPDARHIEYRAKEKSWGPHYLDLGLGLHASTDGDFFYLLRAEHRRTWLNRRGAEWRSVLQFGRDTDLLTELYQPLDVDQRWFVRPALFAGQRLEDFFAGDERVATLADQKYYAGLDVGISPTNTFEASVGIRYGESDVDRNTGSLVLPEYHYKDAALVARALFDNLDAPVLPTSGWYGRFEYTGLQESLGADLDYERLEAVLMKPLSVGANTLYVKAGYGDSLGTRLPPNDAFAIGGMRSLPGLRTGQLRGQSYWLASASYARALLSGGSLLDTALSGGITVSAGRVRKPYDGLDQEDDAVSSLALFLRARTPLGPLNLTAGYASTSHLELALSIGRPIDEGSLFGSLF